MSETLEPEKLKQEKLDLASLDVAAEETAALLRLFPEVRTEGVKVDFDRLRMALGESVDVGKERYGMNWPGKADCFKAIQRPSLGTLLPVREESVNFDKTENLVIEGDNLEVLKLLQKSYQCKVKMIYIDPPYNTGNDFIYPDDYTESLQTYLEYTGQVDSEGRRFSNNLDSDGRFHSKWLNMMYPRLYLAQNLLRENGVIFVSCDDNEVHNLRSLMNEIFGEENFIATVIWQKVYSPKNSAKHFSDDHDYIVVYARRADIWRPELLPRTEEMEARYENLDDDERGPWKPGDLSARNYYSEGIYPITCPSGRVIEGPPPGNYWRVSKEKFVELDNDRRIWWGKDGNNVPAIKRFLSEVRQGRVPQTFWPYSEVGHTQDAKKELLENVTFQYTDNVLDSVKPVALIQRMLQIATDSTEDDIVLDFFAGSGSTGQAVIAQNIQDGGNRHFILVQLPEPLPKPETSLRTISDIAKERVRRVIQRNEKEAEGKLDLESRPKEGFRVLKLATSNFTIWNAATETTTPEALGQQLELHIDHIQKGRASEDLLYEILLKSGFPLATPVETFGIDRKAVHSVANGAMLVCLALQLTHETIKGIADLKPERVVCLDEGFAGNDQLKTNAVLIMKSKGVTKFQTI